MRRLIAAAMAVSVAAGMFVIVGARPSSASWVSNNCHDDDFVVPWLRRIDARAYADIARMEGYEWGGGCWNNNDRDDSPGAPDSGGEGPDCSGLVFKSWELRSTKGLEGFRWYTKFEDIHGPYYTGDYHSPVRDYPFFKVSKARDSMIYMDAFASADHMGLLYTASNPGPNTDYVLEAYNDYYGTDLNVEGYRFDSAYVGSRRGQWSPDCYPRCTVGTKLSVVVLP